MQINMTAHYGNDDLTDRVLAYLQQRGVDLEDLQDRDLLTLDQFHIGGRKSTRKLARMASIDSTTLLLDIGCGIGGAARSLCQDFGCQVRGIEPVSSYCDLATLLTRKAGLAGKIDFYCGAATSLPFGDDTFDVVWMQHVHMNVQDKPIMFAEIARVLREGGRLAIHEAFAGPTTPAFYPVPWASTDAMSHLCRWEDYLALAGAAGLRLGVEEETSAEALTQLRAGESLQQEPPGLALLVNADFAELTRNLGRNLEDQRVTIRMATLAKQAPTRGATR